MVVLKMAWTAGNTFIVVFFALVVAAQIATIVTVYVYANKGVGPDKKTIRHIYNPDGTVKVTEPLRTALDAFVITELTVFGLMTLLFLITYFRSDIGLSEHLGGGSK